MNHRGKAHLRLLKTQRKTTELLEITKEILYQMTPLIHLHVVVNGLDTIRSGGNHRRRITLLQLLAQGVAVVGPVGNQRLEFNAIKPGINADQIMALTGKQHEIRQVAQSVDHHADFGAWTTPRATDGLALGPPFAPAPCWWSRTMVPSMSRYSKSVSADKPDYFREGEDLRTDAMPDLQNHPGPRIECRIRLVCSMAQQDIADSLGGPPPIEPLSYLLAMQCSFLGRGGVQDRLLDSYADVVDIVRVDERGNA